MNKKIKIALMIIILAISLITISNEAFAWSPADKTPIYPQQGGYFCKEKDGPIRFTQISPNFREIVFDETINELSLGHIENTIESLIKSRIISTIDGLSDKARPIPSNSEQLAMYNGDFIPESNTVIRAHPYYYGARVAMTPDLNPSGKSTEIENTRTAYIFTSGAHASPLALGFKKGNYTGSISDTADDTMIQYALWNDETYNEGNIIPGSALYAEACDYEEFYKNNNIKDGYKVNLNSSNAQTIVNRTSQTYIIGPFRATYPDDSRFSYIEEITVVTDKKTVKPTRVIFGSASAEKPYPSTGEEFFVEFSAADANYPTKAQVNISFAYIKYSKAKYDRLSGTGDIYQLVGKYSKNFSHHVENWQPDASGKLVDIGLDYYRLTGEVYLEKRGTYDAQLAAHLLEKERKWERFNELSNQVNLSIELGGIVWEDINGGKESIQDGKLVETEKRIPNVMVTLYKEDGTEVAKTKTDKNGIYRFKGLNAMYKYYVKFTYNGQYYQPTTYSSSSTWGENTWKTNSNATDIRSQRLEYNLKFEKIGSASENYKGANGYNETFTKEQLLGMTLDENGEYVKTREAVIDEFGNLIKDSSSDALTSKMIQYVKDCMMNAYTGINTNETEFKYDFYPVKDIFVIDTFQYPSILTPKAEILYDAAYYINLGLNPREQSDLAIKKDIEKVTLEVNGQKHIYTYDTLENKENAENTWDISLRLSDVVSSNKYYDTNYSREIYTADYLYKVSDYGTNFAELGKSKQDELEVFITYKIMIRNQALSIQAKIDEIVDYYDKDLSYVDERSYIEIKAGENTGIYSAKASENSRYSANTKTTIEGYNNLYVTGLDDKYLEAGQTAYIYLTFKVNKEQKDNEDWVILDEELQTAKEIGVGKENIVEINGYSTRYAKGIKVPNVGDVSLKPAGIVDKDSTPGNLNPLDVPKDGEIKYENFEDDTDKAPNIRIKLNRDDNTVRVISGTVFEDERTNSIKNQFTTTGDGLRDNKDKTLINGVTVQLVELMENGTEHIWRTFENGSGTADKTTPIINKYDLVEDYRFEGNHQGKYAFKSFMPGKYVVRFIYGDTVKTVTPKALDMGGLNEKSYNGQDYKSTTYQVGIKQDKTYTWRAESTWVNGQETLGDVLTKVTTFKVDASNNETANANKNELNAYLYDITESEKITNVSDAKDIESRRNKVNDYSDNEVTNYIAEVLASHKVDYSVMNDRNTLLNDLMANTQMVAETGLMVIEFEYDQIGTDGNKKDNSYKIEHIDLGLEERPKAGLAIDKKVTNVKLALEDGSILFDAKDTATNLLWRNHKSYDVGYKSNLMDDNKFGNIENIRNKNSNKFGLIQLSMDEELMHGATLEITYQVTVNNVGEVDYKDNSFYYTGKVADKNSVVKTRANQVIDYVANNLQFNVNNNSNWEVIKQDELIKDDSKLSLVNNTLKEKVEKYNTIIVTNALAKELLPSLVNKDESSISVPLVLTQLITSENDTDDLTYRNTVEIVKTSNDVARRMEYSVVGNQDPTTIAQELDSDTAEVVRILPPFGNAGFYIIISIISVIAIGIIVVGIIFIKKKVIKNNN